MEKKIRNQPSSKKRKSIVMGFILLLMGLCIYTVAWVGLSGKGSGAGFELTLIWVPLAYVLLLPGSILVLRDFRRTSPLVVMITGAILIVFDHFFSVTLETGNTYVHFYPYDGNLGQVMAHFPVGTLSFTEQFRVVIGVQSSPGLA